MSARVTKRLMLPSKRASKSLSQKTFCEFFAGIGLVREGLQASGWQCIYANDIEPNKRELYALRFGDEGHFHLGDVWNTDDVLSQIHGTPFLATASFPCVDLSLAGHWKGFKGEHSSTLFGFSKAIDELGPRKPKVVMLENVVGFVTSHDGMDFARAASTLADLGYFLDAFIMDARAFVPQSRPRVFVIGVHRSLEPRRLYAQKRTSLFGEADDGPHEAPSSIRPKKLLEVMRRTQLSTGWLNLPIRVPNVTRPSLASMIDLDASQEWWIEEQVEKHYRMMSDTHREEVDGLLATGETHVGTIYRRKRHGSTKAETRFDGLAGCLRTPRGGSARQIVIVVRKGRLLMRWMSPREYARLQGAPDFPLVAKRNQNLFGFGDAVCVPVISWIDHCLLTPLFESVIGVSERAG